MWVSAAHIPGTQNTEADSFSRNFNEAIEWKLSRYIVRYLIRKLEVDRYISWKPDPKALSIDSFSIKWNTEFYSIFPPFSLLGKGTAKILPWHGKTLAKPWQ